MTEERQDKIAKEDEIDLIELVTIIWSKRLFITKVTSAFIVLGLTIGLTSPKEYSTSCTLIPEAMEGGSGLSGSLGGLAALAGVDLGGMSRGSTTINPGLYRSVSQSTPFLLALMNEKFYFTEQDEKVSLYDYYLNDYKVGLFQQILYLPFRFVKWIRPSSDKGVLSAGGHNLKILALTKDQQRCAENLKERILVTMDWDLNVVTIETKMQDPLVAAAVGNFTQDYITKYVTNYAVSKSYEKLQFVRSQFEKRKQEFEDIQSELALFRDQNQYVNTAKAKSEEERLQSRYNLSFNIYNQLAQQVETIKLQINESTPVFTVLEPIQVPVAKSEPNTVFILIIWISVGLAFCVVYILIHRLMIDRYQ